MTNNRIYIFVGNAALCFTIDGDYFFVEVGCITSEDNIKLTGHTVEDTHIVLFHYETINLKQEPDLRNLYSVDPVNPDNNYWLENDCKALAVAILENRKTDQMSLSVEGKAVVGRTRCIVPSQAHHRVRQS